MAVTMPTHMKQIKSNFIHFGNFIIKYILIFNVIQ